MPTPGEMYNQLPSRRYAEGDTNATHPRADVIYNSFKKIMDGSIDLDTDTIKVILLPPHASGDDELLRANLEMARQLAAQGKHPILVTVGQSEEAPFQEPAALARHA
jgi:hypothetical protein